MLTRRLGLLASALVLGAGPALAQQKRPPARKGKDAAVAHRQSRRSPRLAAPSIPPPGGPTSRTMIPAPRFWRSRRTTKCRRRR